jgi:hypothetical protein
MNGDLLGLSCGRCLTSRRDLELDLGLLRWLLHMLLGFFNERLESFLRRCVISSVALNVASMYYALYLKFLCLEVDIATVLVVMVRILPDQTCLIF